MTDPDLLDASISKAFRDLAATSPTPPTDAEDQIESRGHRRRKVTLVGGAVAAAAVVIVGAMVVPTLGGNETARPNNSHVASASDWRELSGTKLANALGLTPVALVDVNDTPSCHQGSGVVLVFKGNPEAQAYCYDPADFGVTNPVDEQLLQLQLCRYEPSAKLTQLAELRVEVVDLARENSREPSPEVFDELVAATEQRDALKAELEPSESE